MSDELAELRARVEALEAKLDGRETIALLQTERVDVVEPDGQLRLTATNKSSSPDTSVDGVQMPGRSRPGLVFFNDKGDECGGLSYGSSEEHAGAIFAFDRVNQDQVIDIRYQENDGAYSAGLVVKERGPGGISETAREAERIEGLPEDQQQAAAEEFYKRPGLGQVRVFIGRNTSGNAVLELADGAGRPRLRLEVTEDGATKLATLDETGTIEREL